MTKSIKIGLSLAVLSSTMAFGSVTTNYNPWQVAGKVKKNRTATSFVMSNQGNWRILTSEQRHGMWQLQETPCDGYTGPGSQWMAPHSTVQACGGLVRNTKSDWKGGMKQYREFRYDFTGGGVTKYAKENPLPIVNITGKIIKARILNQAGTEVVVDTGNGVWQKIIIWNNDVPYYGKIIQDSKIGHTFSAKGELKGGTNFVGNKGNDYEYNSNNHILPVWKDSMYSINEPMNTTQDASNIETPQFTNIHIEGMVLEFKQVSDSVYKVVVGNNKFITVKATTTKPAYKRQIGASYELLIDANNVPAFQVFIDNNINFKANEMVVFSVNGVIKAKKTVNESFKNNHNHIIEVSDFKVIK